MIRLDVKLIDNIAKALGPDSPAVKSAKFRNFGHAAAAIRRDAQKSLKRAPKEQRRRAKRRRGAIVRRATQEGSRPGTPPHTRTGALRKAIVYDATQAGAIVGPRASIVGDSAAAHEFGGNYKGSSYPERPFMGPALDKNLARFANQWEGSIGQQ